MPEEITMPRLSDTMEEGTVARWHRNEGDTVEAGDLLAEIETDKAIMEFEAPDGGVLLKIVVPEGQPVPVGAPIAFVGEAGEAVPEVASVPTAAPTPAPAPPVAPAAPAATPAPAPPPPVAAPSPPTPPQPRAAAVAATGARIKASPLARRIAEERRVDLGAIRGSGPGGRIVRRDVESAQPAGASQTSAPAPAAAPPPAAPGQTVDVPLSPMRATIARRLLESKTTIPHFYEEMEIDMGPLHALREELNASLTDLRLSVNDFVLRAVALTLRRHPKVNASFAGNAVRYYGDIHLGVAVGIEDGLITPVLRQADEKSLRQVSTEVKDLAVRARERKLQPEEFQGGTFTVTNLGMYGIERFSAIINPPEAAILAVGALVEKPVVVEGRLEVGRRMAVVLSADHRVVDGILAAEFLNTFRDLMENPAGLVI